MKKRKKKGGLLITLGIWMIVGAIGFAGYNLYDGLRAGNASGKVLGPLEAAIMPAETPSPAGMDAMQMSVAIDIPVNPIEFPNEREIPDYILNPDMDMPVSRQDGQDYIGILEIPALELKLPVISEWNYPRLRIAPCRYSGSAYQDNMVISAHNYIRHFGSLRRLDGGERVIFTDVDGNRFDYRVEFCETIGPRDVEGMINSGWDLTLFTCTGGGSYRIAARCTRINT